MKRSPKRTTKGALKDQSDSGLDAFDTSLEAEFLRRLEEQSRALDAPPGRLTLEIDGKVVAEFDPSSDPMAFAIDEDALSVELLDENGRSRAYYLVDGPLEAAQFDGGRLRLHLERQPDGPTQLWCSSGDVCADDSRRLENDRVYDFDEFVEDPAPRRSAEQAEREVGHRSKTGNLRDA